VIGRPITAAPDPRAAAAQIGAELDVRSHSESAKVPGF
jgi:orotidine-5'-phosphate decarboxylase